MPSVRTRPPSGLQPRRAAGPAAAAVEAQARANAQTRSYSLFPHRAARSAGVVTTLVTPDQLPALQSMAAELGISIAELPPPPPELPAEAATDVEAARRGLEDLFNLY